MSFLRRPRTWLIGIPVLVVLVAVVGPFVYINFIREDAPDRLTFTEDTTPSSAAPVTPTSDSLDGTYAIADGSVVGYRIKEILFGQDAEAVGRTGEVVGQFVLSGTTIESGSFEVDMASVTSPESQRDGQFRNRIMETDEFPTGTFELTQPIVLDAVPADLEEVTVSATGDLTLHGVTRSVTFDLLARRNGATIEVNGSVPVTFSDYEIDDPSGGPASVGDTGEMEFLLVLTKS